MNWKDCVKHNEAFDSRSRFELPGSFDCNDAFTISDIWGAISWFWTWPGDYLLNIPNVRSFFEMEGTVIGHTASTFVGWFLFFLCVNFLVNFLGPLEDGDIGERGG